MERKLASIQIIDDIQPIAGADFIEVASVKGWKLVVKKGEFSISDAAIYCEIDSFLPIKDEFEFLRKSSYKKMGELEGFRLRTVKLKGQISQGLLLPMILLKDKIYKDQYNSLQVGDDVAEALGIFKYDPPIPAELSGVMKGSFPNFIPKTDEERIQNLTDVYSNFKKSVFSVTEKLDGSSATYYVNNGVFGVCSRNIELVENETNTFWKQARLMNLEEKLLATGKNISIQGELIGENVQSNPYKLKGQKIMFFNAFDIDEQLYFETSDFISLINQLGLETVPMLDNFFTLPESMDELLLYSEGKSTLNPNTEREGIVIRNNRRTISFKAISNKYLLKTDN